MLPPVLEIYVVWHPGDPAGALAGEQVVQHFHGTAFSGLIGGAVEVYVRSEGWRGDEDAPRPIPLPDAPPPNNVAQAELTAIVPVLGTEMAGAVEQRAGAWYEYLLNLTGSQAACPERIGIYPLLIDANAIDRTVLGEIFGPFQRIAAPGPGSLPESDADLRCRDLAQGIAGLAAGGDRQQLTIFISHTKHAAAGEGTDVQNLIARVRSVVHSTRLNEFFDTNDLQPGSDWSEQLRAFAATSALLAVRTDLYATRQWCQSEVLLAKLEGMPVVILDALMHGEERGSFLMDHVPRVPARGDRRRWRDEDICRALNVLVDECLKRELWRRQAELARVRPELNVAWWAPHAPEPVTFAHWIHSERAAGRERADGDLRIIHPDPPLGPDEKDALEQIASIAGLTGTLDVLTPRLLASRGG